MCVTAAASLVALGVAAHQQKRAGDQQDAAEERLDKAAPEIDPETRRRRLAMRTLKARGAARGGLGTSSTNLTGPGGLASASVLGG